MNNIETTYQPYDKFFRRLLSNKMQVAGLLNKYFKFPQKISENNLERYHCKFVNAQFKNRESDVIYKIKNSNIFFLIEHQSKVDYRMSQRIAEYQIEIMKLENPKRENRKNIIIPLIIPLVIYTNSKNKWRAVKKLSELQPKIRGYKNLGIGTYNILDINGLKIGELLDEKLFAYRLLALEKTKNEVELNNIFQYILHTEQDKNNINFLKEIANYIYVSVLKNEKISKEFMEKEEGEKEMNFITMIAEKRDSFIEEGRKEGLKKGLKESSIKIAKKLLKKGLNVEEIKEITGLTIKEIHELKCQN